jgi:hypothetical protein
MINVFRGLAEMPLYRPVAEDELPRRTLRFFKARTTQLTALGFTPCGDFRIRLAIGHYCRLLIDPTGTIACELASIDVILWQRHRINCFFSLLDNLDCVETSDIAIPPHDGQLVLRGMARASLEDVLSAHRELLASLQAERQAIPVALDGADLPVLAVYMAALMHQSMAQSGRQAHNGFADTMPQLQAAVERLLPQSVA